MMKANNIPIRVVLEDLSMHPELDGSYGDPEEGIVYVDENLPRSQQKHNAIHEILEIDLGTQIEHWYFDIIAKDILDGLGQL